MVQPTIGWSAQGIVLVVFSGITLFLDIPPLIWHAKKQNLAPATLISWIVLSNLFNFINPFIWPDDDLTSRWDGSGLCDVEVKLQIGSWVAIPGALVCIMRMLVSVLNTNNSRISPSTGQKRRELAFNITFCFVIPAIIMALHYVVQPNRYLVRAIAGCTPSLDGSWLSIVFITAWPLVITLAAVYYAIFLMIRMHRYRVEFSRMLQESNTTRSRFLRLFLLSVSLVLVLLPWEVYILYRNAQYSNRAYSWSRTHGPYWQLIQPVQAHGQVLFDRWLRMVAGYAVFIFFGLGDDALKMYKGWLHKIGLGHMNLGGDGNPPRARPFWGTWASLQEKLGAMVSSQKSQSSTAEHKTSAARSSVSTYVQLPTPRIHTPDAVLTEDISDGSEGKGLDGFEKVDV